MHLHVSVLDTYDKTHHLFTNYMYQQTTYSNKYQGFLSSSDSIRDAAIYLVILRRKTIYVI